MAEPKELVASAIAQAQAALDAALAELQKLPAFDPGSVAFAAHALNNYLTVIAAGVELALARLADHPDAELRGWLEGTQHATSLMAPLVGQLTSTAAPAGAPLRFEAFDLPTLVRRDAGVGRSRRRRGCPGQPPVQRGQVLAARHDG